MDEKTPKNIISLCKYALQVTEMEGYVKSNKGENKTQRQSLTKMPVVWRSFRPVKY